MTHAQNTHRDKQGPQPPQDAREILRAQRALHSLESRDARALSSPHRGKKAQESR